MWVVPGMGFAGMVLGMRASRSVQIFLLLLAFWLLVNPLFLSGLWKRDGIPWPDNKRGVRMDGV